MSERSERGGPRLIQATSQTDWAKLPQGWRDAAIASVIDAGRGETELSVVAIIACALWKYVQTGGER